MQKELTLNVCEKIVIEAMKKLTNKILVDEKSIKDLEGKVGGRKFFMIVGGWTRDKLLESDKCKDIDILIPNKTSSLVKKNLEIDLTATFENLKIPAKMIKNDTRQINQGHAAGRSLTTLKFQILEDSNPPGFGGKRVPKGMIELDFREMLENETVSGDYKSRDFTINSIYYDIDNQSMFDPTSVDRELLGNQRYQQQNNSVRKFLSRNFRGRSKQVHQGNQILCLKRHDFGTGPRSIF